ncbi:MAG TPA: hypothetical protein PLZ75_08345, partial [Bacteroidales bacterium]|nr:hypothetical protein [Bacteroidales bacterium]
MKAAGILIAVFLFLSPAFYLPAQLLPYQNPQLGTAERVDDLVQRMTIEEKVGQMLKLSLENIIRDENGRVPE